MTRHILVAYPNKHLLDEGWHVWKTYVRSIADNDAMISEVQHAITGKATYHFACIRNMEDAHRWAGYKLSDILWQDFVEEFDPQVVGYLKCLIRQPKGEE
jgi:hypothetical protein